MRVARYHVIIILVAIALASLVPTAGHAGPGGRSDAAAVCAGDGYLQYVDTQGNPFRNAGQCMKYVASGEALEEKPYLTIVWIDTGEVGGEFGGTLTGAGLQPGATVWVTVTEQGGGVSTVASRVVASDGTINTEYGHRPCVIYESMVFATLDRYGNVIRASAPLPC